MKIGRNDPCPCGSGKKYKRCCLDKEENTSKDYSFGRSLQLKGKNAERIVHELAEKSFLIDWCYKNPTLSDGKELCDLLIVFGDLAIIWQIKDLKKRSNGKYNQREVEKNLRQLKGARRILFDLKKPIELENPRRGKEVFNPESVRKIFLISALMGEGEDYYVFVKKINDKTVHVLNQKGIEILLNELDTINDFVCYLEEKESLVNSDVRITLMGGEEELLAYYLVNGRSFSELKKNGFALICDGCWEKLQKTPEYLAKNEENKISYFWDFLIDKAHLSGSTEYENVAREMAKLNRFHRRIKSKAFFEGQVKASLEPKNNFYKRILVDEEITYCFIYSKTKNREIRKNQLANVCFATRGYFTKNQRVFGIATEMNILPEHSFEFCLLDVPKWTEREEKVAEEISSKLGIFKNQKILKLSEYEYPKKE